MQQQDARNRKGNEERKRRETGAEERKTKIAKATSGRRGWGRMWSREIPEKANRQQTTDEQRRNTSCRRREAEGEKGREKPRETKND